MTEDERKAIIIEILALMSKLPSLTESEARAMFRGFEDYQKIFNEYHEEVTYWRKWFLSKYNIPMGLAHECFLYTPCESFVKKFPEENLIDCLKSQMEEI